MPRRFKLKRTVFVCLCLIVCISFCVFHHESVSEEPISRWREGGAYPMHFGLLGVRYESQPLQVYVVEEHHEVVPYWVEAVKANGGKKAILIHIDAHSDMDYPEYDRHFPFGRIPESDFETSLLMQANDEFILSAIAAQLIRTVYFVYPPWSALEDSTSNSHLGLTYVKTAPHFCTCYEYDNDTCSIRGEEDTLNDIVISAKQCSKTWPYGYLELLASRTPAVLKYSKLWALKNLTTLMNELKNQPSGSSLNEEKIPIILDIDEDFFGVHLPSRNLTDVGFTTNDIWRLERMVKKVFCPKYPSLEKVIDEWFQSVIRVIIDRCLETKSVMFPSCAISLWNDISRELLSNGELWLCGDNSREVFRRLFNYITNQNMTREKLDALARMGLCLTSAWSTHLYKPRMRPCVGHNKPDDSVVEEYIPSSEELIQMGAEFTRVLTALPYAPAVVTVCRSSRDGYTPRWLQMKIEAIVLEMLKRKLNVAPDAIHYSPHLAGGREGWDQRWK